MTRFALTLALLLPVACRTKDAPKETGPSSDDSAQPLDADGDGFTADEDCDDDDPAVFPGAEELCDGLDNDCDGAADLDATDAGQWYLDQDGDGYGDGEPVAACEAPDGYAELDGDCRDDDPAYNPGATEEDCTDPNDYNCDGSVGYADDDGDGYAACEECDDADAAVNPGATELCNSIDDDCDGTIDGPDSADAITWYQDADGDAYGDADFFVADCEAPNGYVGDATDCDDQEAAVNPAATELCNGIDDDCDGTIDGPDAADLSTWYADSDGDGYGDPSASSEACDAPSGAVADSSDCDDGQASVNPSASELCNGVDDDCNGAVDDNPTDGTDWYTDADCDGYGDPSSSATTCTQPSGTVADSSDCDDTDPLVHPSALELCNSVDSDCNGSVDDSCETGTLLPTPSGAAVSSPAEASACALVGEINGMPDPHNSTNLGTFMAALEGSSGGLVASTVLTPTVLDYSIRCGSNYSAAPGLFATTSPWPTLSATGGTGGARFRGYINIGCGEELNRTIGLIGNDALTLSIEGATVATVNWRDGQWVKFRYVSFPSPGLYAFEVQWSTNLSCGLDPFELVWAEGFEPGFGPSYDSFCASSSCNSTSLLTNFTPLDSGNLVQSTTGAATACTQCATTADCSSSETCNSAGVCE